MSFIQAAVRGRVELERVGRNPRQELLDYINSPLEIGADDPVQWWGVSTIYCLASFYDIFNPHQLSIASSNPISDTCQNSKRLSRHPGLLCPI
jgi:hypothetical protein